MGVSLACGLRWRRKGLRASIPKFLGHRIYFGIWSGPSGKVRHVRTCAVCLSDVDHVGCREAFEGSGQ